MNNARKSSRCSTNGSSATAGRSRRCRPAAVSKAPGDALYCGPLLFAGYVNRSEISTHAELGRLFECPVLSLELVESALLSPRHLLLSAQAWRRTLLSGSVRRIRPQGADGEHRNARSGREGRSGSVRLQRRRRRESRRPQFRMPADGRRSRAAWFSVASDGPRRVHQGGRFREMSDASSRRRRGGASGDRRNRRPLS